MTSSKTVALACLVAASVPCSATAAFAGSLDGAKLEVRDAASEAKPCPKSSFEQDRGGEESFLPIVGGLLSSFAGKAIDGFVDWLEKRKERLNGSRTATYTGEFYRGDQPRMGCVIFTAGTFRDEGSETPKVYAEFVPVFYDLGAYTLKPVYLDYRGTVAEARSKAKFTSLVLTTKYNVPATKNAEGAVNSSQLTDGASFTFNFGKLPIGTVLDHKALEAVNGGLGQVAPHFPNPVNKDLPRPLAYQMSALWAETAEPSPLYTAAVGSLKDHKDEIGKEIGSVIKEILGIKEGPAAAGK